MDKRDAASRWPLVGRDPEFERFAVIWAEHRCHGVVVHGPAGVGKSRLADEFLAEAVRRGHRDARASASAASAVVPLGAISHLLPTGGHCQLGGGLPVR